MKRPYLAAERRNGRARTDAVQDALGEERIVIAGGEEHRAADRPQLVEGDGGVEAVGGRRPDARVERACGRQIQSFKPKASRLMVVIAF